jgi:hypothetical protein
MQAADDSCTSSPRDLHFFLFPNLQRMKYNPGAVKIRADIQKNTIYIKLTGNIRKKHLESLYTDIRFCVADLQPGFTVINDLSEATIGHLSGIATFKKIMAYLASCKVGAVIRIAGKSSLIIKQVMRISALIQGYTPIYASNMEEAERKLAELGKH